MDDFKLKKVDVLNSEFSTYCEVHRRINPGNRLSRNWFRWYHIMMNDDTRTYGIYDGERLFGVFNVEPCKFLYQGKIIKVGRIFGVGIEEEYRKKGLFVKLCEYSIKQEKQRGELDYFIGYPRSDNPVACSYVKSGFYKTFDIPVYEIHRRQLPEEPKPIKNIVNMGSLGFPRFVPPIDGFVNDKGVKRFLEHPESLYFVLSTNPNKNYIIMKPYSSWCHILDVVGEPDQLLDVAKTFMYGNGLDYLTIWCSDKEIYKNNIVDAGFEDAERAYSMMVCNIKSNSNMEFEICHLQNWTEEIF